MSSGGLDEALNTILTMCQEQNVPFVFALGRRALGRACAKLVPVSVVGIFNYEGCEVGLWDFDFSNCKPQSSSSVYFILILNSFSS